MNVLWDMETSDPFSLGRLVAQGGFAGEGLVAPDRQLPKFRGKVTCATYNLNGDIPSAHAVLASSASGIRRFVSKNICHGVVYDRALHEHVDRLRDQSLSLDLIWKGMETYFERHPDGKLFHDPLAACCAIDESVAEWAEVELYRTAKGGEWGSRLAPGSGTWITTGCDHERFVATLLATP